MNPGNFLQGMAIFSGIAAIVLYIISLTDTGKNKSKSSEAHTIFRIGNGFLILQTVLVTVAIAILLHALITGNFSYNYVASYTDRGLPLVYKICALWAGQAGSLLFWVWLATIFAAFEVWRNKAKDRRYQAFSYIVMAFTNIFFLFLCVKFTNPFELLPFLPRDGQGMNPMLQNPGMIIHPPLLYIGFVGFTIPFAHAFASSFVKDASIYWVKASHPWIIITWVFLTAGIVLGGWWAYVELGWGGYWAWDPVENASLFPWITATALIHASIIYERKSRLKGWTYSLVGITFVLTIFGTFLTRSGIMSGDSVHSFPVDTIYLGASFVVFMVIATVAFLIGMALNKNLLLDKEEFNFTSKEGAFFVGLLCFSALTLALIFYTMLPVISGFLGRKISVMTNSYNLVSIPFFTVIFLLAGIAPILTYGRTIGNKFIRAYLPVFIGALLIVILSFGLGYKNFTAAVLTFASATALLAFLFMGIKAIKSAGLSAVWRFRRLFGAVIAHVGLAIMVFGVIFSALFSYEKEGVVVEYNGSFEFGPYTLQVEAVENEHVKNYSSDYIPFNVYIDGVYQVSLFPEIREYDKDREHYERDTSSQKQRKIYREVAYHTMFHGDLYLIFDDYDTVNNLVRVTAIFQPLIVWIWVGSIIMCLGALYGLTQRSRENG